MGFEIAGSLAAGLLASSFALLAFGMDSLVELISAVVVMRHLKHDSEGAELQGEGTAVLTSLLLFALIPTIGVGSLYSFFIAKAVPEASPIGLVVAAGAVLVMPFLWLKKKKIGIETNCLPLTVDAVESATCFLMSLTLLGGLAVEFVFRVGWADLIATMLILGFVAKEAVGSLKEARHRSCLILPTKDF